MITLNSTQVVFSAECQDRETGETLAYFDANYDAAHMYLSMTIYQDDPIIMEDFAVFKENVVSARDNQGVIEYDKSIYEDMPEEGGAEEDDL